MAIAQYLILNVNENTTYQNLWKYCNTMYWFLFLGINIRKKSIWRRGWLILSISSVQSRPTLCDPMDCSIPDFPVHQSPDLAQNHVYRVGDAIQPSHPLSSPSSPVLNLSQHQGLFQWVNSLHQVAKVLEFQLQHQSFQWIVRTDF